MAEEAAAMDIDPTEPETQPRLEPRESSPEPTLEPAEKEPMPTDTAEEEPKAAAEPTDTVTTPQREAEEERSEGEPAEHEDEPSPTGMRINVILLEEGRREMHFDVMTKGVKGADIIDWVMAEAEIREPDYFSLYFYDTKDTHPPPKPKIFIDPSKPVLKQLPDCTKQRDPATGKEWKTWTLWFGVKFYVPNPHISVEDGGKLKWDHSQHFYCLQLCCDIKENRVLIDPMTAHILTALMLQGCVEVGDYDEEKHTAGYVKEHEEFMLLPGNFQPHDYEDYEAEVRKVHKEKVGYTLGQADREFLERAKDLTRYGEHLFQCTDEHGALVQIGNSYQGISVWHGATRSPNEIFPWPDITRISYRRGKFIVKHHLPPEEEGGKRRKDKRVFECSDRRAAKRLWKNAVEQHTFFRMHRPHPPRPKFVKPFSRTVRWRWTLRTQKQAEAVNPDEAQALWNRPPSVRRSVTKPNRRTKPPLKKFVIGKQDTENEEWIILHHPPREREVDESKFEHQRVSVEFRIADGLPEDKYKYVIRRNENGFELQQATLEQPEEPSYRLSVVEETSKWATTIVSLNIEPRGGAPVSHQGGATTVFDSQRMPVVKLGSAAAVTTATVIEHSGKPVSSGAITQQYPFENGDHDIGGELGRLDNRVTSEVGPAVDGSEEAEQVNLFLEKEHLAMQAAFEGEETPAEIAVH